MMINNKLGCKILNLCTLVFSVLLAGCSSDDSEKYQPITTITNPDSVEVNQNTSIVISFLGNDSNVPSDAIINISSATYGTASLQNNNTPETVLDDSILYTPDTNYVGTDSITYTICSLTNNEDCVDGTITITVLPVSGVAYTIDQEPYQSLSEYLFFEAPLNELTPTYGVIPYEPISSLFSDYAHKKRFVWMPTGVSATYVEDGDVLNFPVGTILIKNFFYENVQPVGETVIIETRLMLRTTNGWQFANYVWNDDQTDAFYDMEGSFKSIEWLEEGVLKNVNYRIPSASECFTCHKSAAVSIPIGPKPQNLNKNLVYSGTEMNQLQKLIEFGYLENTIPQVINTVVEWNDESHPIDLRLRSYVDINCAHCHSDETHCFYRPMRFAFNESDDNVNLGVCVEPQEQFDGLTYITSPGDINRSMLHFRVSTTLAQRRMPLLGRTLVHEEAVEMIEEWINSLNINCQ
jgi:uncharacterized repeat protein (TIGR03806 family)